MREFALVFALVISVLAQLDQADPWSRLERKQAWILLTKVDQEDRIAVTKNFRILDRPKYEMRQLPIPGDRILLRTPYRVTGLDFIADKERDVSANRVLTEEDYESGPFLPQGAQVIVKGLNYMTVQNSSRREVWALVTPP